MRPHRRCFAPVTRSAFAGFCFPPDVIVLAVRWYLRFALSYRDVEELLAERGIEVDHTTVYRWVQRFTPMRRASRLRLAPRGRDPPRRSPAADDRPAQEMTRLKALKNATKTQKASPRAIRLIRLANEERRLVTANAAPTKQSRARK
jgi:hypothetical protein